MKATVLLLPIALACATLSAQDIQKADTLTNIWKRTKSLAEPKAEVRRTKGASLEIVEVTVDADTQVRFNNLQFALDSDKLEGAVTFQQLAEIAAAMKMAGSEKFLIEGHTCDLGTTDHNKELSRRRAQSVVEALVKLGVDRSRVQPLGFGEEEPFTANTSEAQRAQNRRVQIFRKL
jgi:outer membrane protein OmpA-like peptidoglycan-associated protein